MLLVFSCHASQSPSFFPNDLRRLKLVSKNTLIHRAKQKEWSFFRGMKDASVLTITEAQNMGEAQNMAEGDYEGTLNKELSFFLGIKDALVLTIAEAQNMSGGDYDGDRAWVCWNNDLLQCMPDVIKAEDTSHLTTAKSDLEQKLWRESCMYDLLRYVVHFRGHQRRLAQLSEELDLCIDKHGFDQLSTKELGRAAFLQVSIPKYSHLSTCA
jgi:hypothetical protein